MKRPIVQHMAPSPTGKGYYMLTSDGGVYTWGDARFEGTTSARPIPQPVITIEANPTGSGYWLIGADGAVYPFGGASPLTVQP